MKNGYLEKNQQHEGYHIVADSLDNVTTNTRNSVSISNITAIKYSGDIGDYFCGIKTQHQHIKVWTQYQHIKFR